MKNLWLLLGSLGATLVIVVVAAFLFAKKANAPVLPVDSKLVLGQTKNNKGKSEAKVTIVEFSDLQCPACKAVQPLVDEVVKSSDSVRLVYRHYPLQSIHKNAMMAARAAEAAARQNKFWEMHDKLFAGQSDWESLKDPKDKFSAYAKELTLDEKRFASDYASADTDRQIIEDQTDGNTIGVNATPSFYVNAIKTDASDLKNTVDKLLKK